MAGSLNGDFLLDECGTPTLRSIIGMLLARAVHADVAIQHVRLAAIDLTPPELARVHCRILLGRLDADDLSDLALAQAGSARLAATAAFLDSGRLQIRAAGLLRWKPDFSVFELRPPLASVALVGAHYFSDPDVIGGPALTCIVLSPAAVLRLRRRFGELWEQGRDVHEVVRAELATLRP